MQAENADKLLKAGVDASKRSAEDQVERMFGSYSKIEKTIKDTLTPGELLALQAEKQQISMANQAAITRNQMERPVPLMALSGTELSVQTIMDQENQSQAIEVESIPL